MIRRSGDMPMPLPGGGVWRSNNNCSVIVVPVSSIVFKTFSCEEMSPGVWFLQHDLDVQCFTERHTAWAVYASVCACIYPIGNI